MITSIARWFQVGWSTGFTGAMAFVLQFGWFLVLTPIAQTAESASPATSTIAPHRLAQPSAADLEAMSRFGEKLALAISTGNTNQLVQLCDYPAMWELIVQDIQAPEAILMRAKLGFLKGMKRSPGGIFREGLGKEMKSMRVRERNGEPVLLMRMRMGEFGGATYLEVFLTRDAEGDYRVRDFYNFALGETVSSVMSRLVAKGIAAESKSSLEALFKRENTAAKEIARTIELTDLLQRKQYREVLDQTDALPTAVRKERLIQFVRVSAAIALQEDARYVQVLDEISAAFPNDPSLGLILVDRHFLKKEYTKALEIVAGLIRDLGRDAFLSELEASCLGELGRSEDALKVLAAGLKVEEGDRTLLWSQVSLLSKGKRYAEMTEVLDEILKRHEQFADPAKAEKAGLQGFFASPEGVAYVARLKMLGKL